MFMAATRNTDPTHFKRFKLVISNGVMVTAGERLGKLPMLLLTGKTRLPLLEHSNPLTQIIMYEVHEEDHLQADTTLKRSCRTAWIGQGGKLAKAVCKACMWCRLNNPVRLQQDMGMIPDNAAALGSMVWATTHVAMFGPYKVKSMVNCRAKMKVWPVLMVCEVIGSIHTELLAGASTQHFLVEWAKFVDLQGRLSRGRISRAEPTQWPAISLMLTGTRSRSKRPGATPSGNLFPWPLSGRMLARSAA